MSLYLHRLVDVTSLGNIGNMFGIHNLIGFKNSYFILIHGINYVFSYTCKQYYIVTLSTLTLSTCFKGTCFIDHLPLRPVIIEIHLNNYRYYLIYDNIIAELMFIYLYLFIVLPCICQMISKILIIIIMVNVTQI